jgi:hypothetical protein
MISQACRLAESLHGGEGLSISWVVFACPHGDQYCYGDIVRIHVYWLASFVVTDGTFELCTIWFLQDFKSWGQQIPQLLLGYNIEMFGRHWHSNHPFAQPSSYEHIFSCSMQGFNM